MNITQQNTARILTFAGILPFAAGVLGQILAPELAPWPVLTVSYGAVIAAFIAGIHWAVFLYKADQCRINLLLSSNILALAAWLALLLPSGPWPLRLLLVIFVALIVLDRRLHLQSLIPDWFYRLRVQASTVVTVCLLAMAIAVM